MDRQFIARRASTPSRTVRRLGFLVAGLLLIAAIGVGCGESDADKAQSQVCDAVTDLKVQVDDLNQISDAQGDLSEDRRQQVESATQEFAAEVEAVASGLGSDLSLSGAKAELEAAGRQLARSYQQAFAEIDCE